MSMLRAKAALILATANGAAANERSSGRNISFSLRRTFRLPLMKRTEYMTVRRAVLPGYLASRNGTAARLSFSESHIPRDITVSTEA